VRCGESSHCRLPSRDVRRLSTRGVKGNPGLVVGEMALNRLAGLPRILALGKEVGSCSFGWPNCL